MAVLLTGSADVADVQRIPTFDAATSKFFGLPTADRDAILGTCQTIVQEFGLEEIIAIDLKHKHFDMPCGYAICEEQFKDEKKSIMKPTLLEKLDIQPTPFAFILIDGQWKPYEFVMDCPSACDGLASVSEQPAFLAKLSAFLEENALDDVLGIHVLHREHLGGEARGTVETPGDTEEQLLLRPYTEDMFAKLVGKGGKQVMWSWCNRKSPMGHLCFGCTHNCTNHCHNHCNEHKDKK
jgi:hypothetical protein